MKVIEKIISLITENSIISVVTPNGIEIEATVIKRLETDGLQLDSFKSNRWLCYAQNRLFTVWEKFEITDSKVTQTIKFDTILVDYCIIPDLD